MSILELGAEIERLRAENKKLLGIITSHEPFEDNNRLLAENADLEKRCTHWEAQYNRVFADMDCLLMENVELRKEIVAKDTQIQDLIGRQAAV